MFEMFNQWDGLRGWVGSQSLCWIRHQNGNLTEKGFSHVFLMEKCSTIPFPGIPGLELPHPSGLVPAQMLTGNDHPLDLCRALVDLWGEPETGEPGAVTPPCTKPGAGRGKTGKN